MIDRPARIWRFESRWPLPGPVGVTYAVLADVEHYPTWWPQVRAVARLGEDRGLVLIRSVLPMTLELELTSRLEDPDSGVLEVAIDGDLVGWSRFTLISGADGAPGEVRYAQEVRTHRWFLNAAPRALLRANHGRMMRAAERGLADRVDILSSRGGSG